MKEKEITTEVKLSKYIDLYWRPFLVVFCVVIIGFLGFLAFNLYNEKNEKLAQEKLFEIQKLIEKQMSELKKDVEKNPENLSREFSKSLADLDVFIDQNTKYRAAKMAAMRKAEMASEFKDWPLAEKTLLKVKSHTKESEIFYGLIRTQLATALFNQNKSKDAISILEEIINNKKLSYFHPHALVRLGVGYYENGEFEKAMESFKKVESDFAQTQAAQEAKNFQKLIALKKGA